MATETVRVVTYKQLLKLAHERGLTTITTELLQAPTEGNDRVAICKATVTLERDGRVMMFQGMADAAPNNVKPAMVNCLLRLAETRSKARALRDAVNIGDVSAEELDSYDDAAAAPVAKPKLSTSVAGRTGCPTCPVTNPAPGTHHAPGCPQRTEARAA
jgi:hypothetical protein